MGQSFSTPIFTPALTSEDFTSVGVGQIYEATPFTYTVFSIQVLQNGGVLSAWKVVLQASIDGVFFTDILTHDTTMENAEVLYSNSGKYSSVYFRANIKTLDLGTATSITVKMTATN